MRKRGYSEHLNHSIETSSNRIKILVGDDRKIIKLMIIKELGKVVVGKNKIYNTNVVVEKVDILSIFVVILLMS
jgi:hypothetical protein